MTRSLSDLFRPTGLRLAWLACAVLFAFGGAGIVSGMEHPPGTAARAELTWTADQRISPGLAGSAGDLGKLTADVDGLSTLGTNALVAVNGGNIPAIQAAIADGATLIAQIETETAALRTRLAGLPGVGPGAEGRLGGVTLQRYETLNGALDATSGIADSWNRLTTGSLAAVQLETTLFDHDAATGEAARLGSGGNFDLALTQLLKSAESISAARGQANAMSAAVDVSLLNEWIDRNDAYDATLVKLYGLLKTSGGKVTKAIQAAFADEQAARAQLPGDTRGLIVIMGDVARGELNTAVISIEDAKGRLSAALDAFSSVGGDAGPDSGSPGASASPSGGS